MGVGLNSLLTVMESSDSQSGNTSTSLATSDRDTTEKAFSRNSLFSSYRATSTLPSAYRSSASQPMDGTPQVVESHKSFPSNLRLGEKRRGQRMTPNFNLNQPRGRLQELFSAESEGTEGQESKIEQSNQRAGFVASPLSGGRLSVGMLDSRRQAASSRSNARSPEKISALFTRMDGLLTGSNNLVLTRRKESASSGLQASRPGISQANFESLPKKRKSDGLSSANSSVNLINFSQITTPSKVADVIKLETEVKRLTFERDSAKKLVELERSDIEEKLRQRRQEEEDATAKTAEMWSQAEKIIAENDRLKARIEKTEGESIAMRKKYEDQIGTLRSEAMDKERQLDKNLREIRLENLAGNEKLKSVTRECGLAREENHVYKQKIAKLEQLAAESLVLRNENHELKIQIQVKDGKINDLSTANTMLSNLPEEIRHYRDLQITVPLLQKENQKLREKAALARANEDKIHNLEESIKRYEERQCRFYDLELENDHLKSRVEEWDSLETLQSPSRKPLGIQKLMEKVTELESSHKSLVDELSQKNHQLFENANTRLQLEQDIVDLKSALELKESARLRLESALQDTTARLTATATERDTLRLIKETIDASSNRRDPITQSKIRDLEERATRTETLAVDFEQLCEKALASERDLKIQLEDMHMRYEEVVVKNHDALQTLTKETEELRAGKEKLQEQLEIWKFHKIRGEYDRTTMQIITLEESPADIAQKKYLDEATKAIEENKILKEKLNLVKTSGSYPADLTLSAEEYLKGPGEQLEDLKNKLDKSEKQRSSDMVAFRKTSSNFRHVIRDLLGWTVRLDSNKVTFHVADAPPDEMIIFEREDENKPWNLKATDYTAANEVFVSEFLRSHHSPPGFFARIILKILSERTLICLDSATP